MTRTSRLQNLTFPPTRKPLGRGQSSNRNCCLCLLAALFALGVVTHPRVSAADGVPRLSVVRISTGVLRGQSRGTINVFRGIPYAQPPIGKLRFRAPQPAARWSGVRSAERFGPGCPQPTFGSGVASLGSYFGTTSEDCLTLNVWAPKHARQAPVMVWIFGGGNRFGSASFAMWNGAAFARDGVILVSFNYRLGGLGYFAHPALTAEVAQGEPLGNYALMDQIAVLQWVHHNIAAFGGDPHNVTLFGESSGANETLWLLTVPSARALFQKAIVESAGGWIPPSTLSEREQDGVKLAHLAGLNGSQVTAAALRALPASAFLDASFKFDFEPFIDGRLVTETPTQAFAQNRFVGRPLIIGFNSFEGSVWRPNFISALHIPVRQLAGLYPSDLSTDLSKQLLWGDQYDGAPSRWIAARMSTKAPAYLYRFSYVPDTQPALLPGAPHGGELPFVFDSWDRFTPDVVKVYRLLSGGKFRVTAQDRAVTALVHGCWVAFAKTGHPRCPGGPAWPQYSVSADQLMDFDRRSTVRNHVRKAQFDALERLLLPGDLSSSR